MAPLTPVRRDSYLTPHLVPPSRRDSDTSSIHSIHSEQESDSEDDSVLENARTSDEVRDHDRSVLEEEEEMHRILTEARTRRGSGLKINNPFKKMMGRRGYEDIPGSSRETLEGREDGHNSSAKRKERAQRRKARKEALLASAATGEDRSLLYTMEEGEWKSGSETGESSDVDGLSESEKMALHSLPLTSRRGRVLKWLFVAVTISLFLVLLVLGAVKLSSDRGRSQATHDTISKPHLLSNGTALFAPTTLLISLDGFRADFINRHLTPHLESFISQGLSAPYMTPSFPSVTFPNHYTLLTGLYPSAHGIVGNNFYDPVSGKSFYYTSPEHSHQAFWWDGSGQDGKGTVEPLWVTAEKKGIKTWCHMWPGCESRIGDIDPSILDPYRSKFPLDAKVERVLEVLDLPGLEVEASRSEGEGKDTAEAKRPQFLALYIPQIDVSGHYYGPDSARLNETLISVDQALGTLFSGLSSRNLTDIVNVVIVSDHGMAASSNDRLIQIEEYLDLERYVEGVDGWPLYGLWPKSSTPETLDFLYDTLMNASLHHSEIAFKVYRTDGANTNMPERYHFEGNPRIAPLWVVPRTGWAIVTEKEFSVSESKTTGAVYAPAGIHGYDNRDPAMRAIFFARGPAFGAGKGGVVEPFENVDVYNLLCDSIGLKGRLNNGTLHLPLLTLSAEEAAFYANELVGEEKQEEVVASVAPPPLWRPVVTFAPSPDEVGKGEEGEPKNGNPVIHTLPPPPEEFSHTPIMVHPSSASSFSPHPEVSPFLPPPAAPSAPVSGEGQSKAPAEGSGDGNKGNTGEGQGEGTGEEQKSAEGGRKGWWEWVKDKAEEAKDWVSGLLTGDVDVSDHDGDAS